MPSEPVGHDVEQPPHVFHVVRIGRGNRFPRVAGRIGCRNTQGPQRPLLAVGAVVGQRLAGPLAGDEHPPPGVAEVIGVVGLALAPARRLAGPGALGLDAVPQSLAHSTACRRQGVCLAAQHEAKQVPRLPGGEGSLRRGQAVVSALAQQDRPACE